MTQEFLCEEYQIPRTKTWRFSDKRKQFIGSRILAHGAIVFTRGMQILQEIIQTNSSILSESLISKSGVDSNSQFNSTNSMGEYADKSVKSPN